MSEIHPGKETVVAQPSDAIEILENLIKLQNLVDESSRYAFQIKDLLFGASPTGPTIEQTTDTGSGSGLLDRIRVLVNSITDHVLTTNTQLEKILNRCNH